MTDKIDLEANHIEPLINSTTAAAIRRRVAPFAGIELEEHPPVSIRAVPAFEDEAFQWPGA